MRRLHLRRYRWLLAVVAVGLSVVACAKKQPQEVRKPVHPVRGKVMVQGKPAVTAFVLLIPVKEPAESPDPRPRAEVEADGSFALSTYGEKDGAPAGDYNVSISWPDRESGSDRLQGRYANAAAPKLKATVKEGPNELPAFDLR